MRITESVPRDPAVDSVDGASREPDCSRRRFVGRALISLSAAVPLAAGMAAMAPVPARAQDPRAVVEVAVLNYLLRLEYLQQALYRRALTRFSAGDFTPYGASTWGTLLMFEEQETTHVATLRDFVERLGAPVQPDCGDRFPRFRDPAAFLETALVVENAVVSAYLGVTPMLRLPQVQTAVTSIATVEARHSAFVGFLNGVAPAPAAADTPRARAEVAQLLAPYFRSCGEAS